MSKQLKLRGGSAAAHRTFVGAKREVTVVDDDFSLRIHDGATPGGRALAGGGASTPTMDSTWSMRNVITRGIINAQVAIDAKYSFTRSRHINRGPTLTSGGPTFENRYHVWDHGAVDGPGPTTYWCDLEYPVGMNPPSLTTMTWNGQDNVILQPGERRVADQAEFIAAIPHGAEIVFRTRTYCEQGVLISDGRMAALGEDCNLSATPFDDWSKLPIDQMPGMNNSDKGVYPLEFIAMSDRASVLITGDSRFTGVNDDTNSWGSLGGIGEICRSLDYGVAYTMAAVGGESVFHFNSHPTERVSMLGHHTHVHCGHGCGDLYDFGHSAATIIADMQTQWNLFKAADPTKKISQSTIVVSTHSDAGFDTVAEQTSDGSDPQRLLLNALLLQTWNYPQLWHVFDSASVLDDPINKDAAGNMVFMTPEKYPGLIRMALASDGCHYSPFGYGYMQRSGLYAWEQFTVS